MPCPSTLPTLYLQGTVATLTFADGSAIGNKNGPPGQQVKVICGRVISSIVPKKLMGPYLEVNFGGFRVCVMMSDVTESKWR